VSKPARLWIVRHGETEYNAEDRWQGARTDLPLNDRGRAQAEAVAARLVDRNFAALYTSPMIRARQTAEAVAERTGLEPIEIEALREADHGHWEGKTKDEILADWPTAWKAFEADPMGVRRPGGESYGDTAGRVWPALEAIAARHTGQDVVVVTHGGPLRLVLSEALDLPLTRRDEFGTGNASLFVVAREGDGWRLVREGV